MCRYIFQSCFCGQIFLAKKNGRQWKVNTQCCVPDISKKHFYANFLLLYHSFKLHLPLPWCISVLYLADVSGECGVWLRANLSGLNVKPLGLEIGSSVLAVLGAVIFLKKSPYLYVERQTLVSVLIFLLLLFV